jgi:hypothetical protein
MLAHALTHILPVHLISRAFDPHKHPHGARAYIAA